MASSMSPSEVTPITPGQMGKFYDHLVAALGKSDLPGGPTQKVIERCGPALAHGFVELVRPYVADFTLQEFTFDVDFDDPRWQCLEGGNRRFVYDGIKPGDYPCPHRGKYRVTAVLYPVDHDVLDEEIIERANRNGDTMPVRPVMEVFSEKFPDEQQQAPVIGICGEPVSRFGYLRSPCVDLHSDGAHFYWHWTEGPWPQHCRFLVLRNLQAL